MQPTGSFKVRGAFSDLTKASIPTIGVAAASGGNFGLAVAYAAAFSVIRPRCSFPRHHPTRRSEGSPTSGRMSESSPAITKPRSPLRANGAREAGAYEVHAYDHPDVVAGQGTCGKEILEQVRDADSILVAVGGGGLIAGIATWARDGVSVVGVESEGCPALHEARDAGKPVDVTVGGIAASALGRPGSATTLGG